MLCLFALALSLPLLAQSDDDVAMRFYPERLDDIYRQNHDPGKTPRRYTTLLRLDLDRSGREDYLAVAYSNGLAAGLLLIKGSAANAVVVAEAPDKAMGGKGIPVLEPVDIDDDGVPELLVRFWRESWVYRYSGGELVLFGPTRIGPQGPTSNLGNVTMFDLDGDGTLEILEEAPPSVEAAYIAHKLGAGGTFTQLPGAIGFADRFERAEGEPEQQQRQFAAKPGDYILRVVNGDQEKKNTVTSGEIRLNGKLVAGPSDFKKASNTFSVPVKLLADNALTVDLRSDPASFLYISLIRK